MDERKEKELADILNNPNAVDRGEMGEVTRQFTENNPSSSNLTSDEHKLVWRAKAMLEALSPESVKIIDDYIDGKRSVGGWNTDQKVLAITGIQQQRQGLGGRMMDALFKPKQPGV